MSQQSNKYTAFTSFTAGFILQWSTMFQQLLVQPFLVGCHPLLEELQGCIAISGTDLERESIRGDGHSSYTSQCHIACCGRLIVCTCALGHKGILHCVGFHPLIP